MYVLSLVGHYVKKLSIMFTYVYELNITMQYLCEKGLKRVVAMSFRDLGSALTHWEDWMGGEPGEK